MAKVEIKTQNNTMNTVELKKAFDKDGVSFEHVYIDGEYVTDIGYTNEADKQAGINALLKAYESSNNNLYSAALKMHQIASLNENEVSPDEQVTVEGEELVVSYAARKLYDLEGVELVNIDDIQVDMPNEAIKAILIERMKNMKMKKNGRMNNGRI